MTKKSSTKVEVDDDSDTEANKDSFVIKPAKTAPRIDTSK